MSQAYANGVDVLDKSLLSNKSYLSTPSEITAFQQKLSWSNRPPSLSLTGPELTERQASRLEKDLTACGCTTGGLAGITTLLLLITFARGPFEFGLVAFWILSVIIATAAVKVSVLSITYLRACRDLSQWRERLVQAKADLS